MRRRNPIYTGGVWETNAMGWLRWVEVDGYILLRKA